MNRILLSSIAALTFAVAAAPAAELTVFRICEDQHVLRTSDGAEAGRVEYIVVEPSSFRVVSAVVHGGVVADKHVAVPISTLRFGTEREITLTNITREKLVSAPVFETTRLTTRAVIEPTFVERSYTHFGVDVAEITRTSSRTDTEIRGSATERTTTGGSVDRTTVEGSVRTNEQNMRRDPADPNQPSRRDAAAEGHANPPDRRATTPDDPASKGDAAAARRAGRSEAEAESSKAKENKGSRSGSGATDPSIGRTDATPGKSDTAPGKSDTAPGKSDTAPGKSDTAPGKSDTAPGKSDTAPGKSGTAPGKRDGSETTDPADQEPGRRGAAPGRNDATPGKNGTAPGKQPDREKPDAGEPKTEKNAGTPGQDRETPGKGDSAANKGEGATKKKSEAENGR